MVIRGYISSYASKMMKMSSNSILPTLNLMCSSPVGLKLSPSTETTFLLVGNGLNHCCIELKNLCDIVLIDRPVSNKACVHVLLIWMLYNAWKPSMNTSLIMDNTLDETSHAEESSESSSIMFSNSKMKLLTSSVSSLADV